MHRLWTAIRVFFLTLFRADVARQIDEVLQCRRAAIAGPREAAPESPQPKVTERPMPTPAPRARSQRALTCDACSAKPACNFVKERWPPSPTPKSGPSRDVPATAGPCWRDVCPTGPDRCRGRRGNRGPGRFRRRPLSPGGERGGRTALPRPSHAPRLGSHCLPGSCLVGQYRCRANHCTDGSGTEIA